MRIHEYVANMCQQEGGYKTRSGGMSGGSRKCLSEGDGKGGMEMLSL